MRFVVCFVLMTMSAAYQLRAACCRPLPIEIWSHRDAAALGAQQRWEAFTRTRECWACAAASGSDDELEQEAALQRARDKEYGMFEIDEQVLLAAGTVWALLFNAGSGNEGIYSRRLPDVGDLVVTFEDLEDAERYIGMLSATDFPESVPHQVETKALLEFCSEGGHTLGLVRRGVLVLPPEQAVTQFEWSPGVSEEGRAAVEDPDALEAQRRALEASFRVDKQLPGSSSGAADDEPPVE